ncbi:hypothetical protein OG339_10690 [Streptosporangium sp. NBC_01495]|uniref:hypothetical protein n=1 Tax=Streptosporangium sp. NBC_01495 TaxID=2903899 RepID=UPI002E328FF8|nr:hypothetical protein [Streptosporangium sp. NBC_01495]
MTGNPPDDRRHAVRTTQTTQTTGMPQTAPGGRPGMPRRVAPALGLFLLSPLVAEYLLGNVPSSEIGGLVILAPMYGGGAIIIREVVRRTGRGWPTLLLLACAYGVLEAALIDQTLFNPAPLFEEDVSRGATLIPALGFSAGNAMGFTAGHAIWSIGVPIAVVEILVPRRATTPWLGIPGLIVTCVVFVLGSLVLFNGIYDDSGFMASPPQRIGAAVVVALLVVAAFLVGRRPRPVTDGRSPRPWLVGAVCFVASAAFFVRPEDWWGTAVGVALLAVMTVVISRWSRGAGWGAAHRLALAGGALLTYAFGGFILLLLHGTANTVNLIGQTVLVLGTLALFLAARRTVRGASGTRGTVEAG